MRIAIDARLEPGMRGGVEQAIQGFAYGLAQQTGSEQFGFLVYDGCSAWLEPYISGPCRLLPAGPAPTGPRADRLPAWVRPMVPLVKGVRRFLRPLSAEIPDEPAAVGDFAADVVHLALQTGFHTTRPSIFHPYDLQHVHFPENFLADDWRKRDFVYRTLAQQAAAVVALTRWGADDIAAHLDIPRERIAVIPLAAPMAQVDEPWEAEAAAAVGVTGEYAIYPAQTWPHKNHRTLIEAWAALHAEHGPSLSLICTGRLVGAGRDLPGVIERLGLAGRVIFTGHIEARRLAGLLRGARLMVYPSRFEGWGLPLVEAFALGLPVACATASCLPEVAGDAAVMFDPTAPAAIAAAVWRCATDQELRRTLIARGRQRSSPADWTQIGSALVELYRRVGASA